MPEDSSEETKLSIAIHISETDAADVLAQFLADAPAPNVDGLD